MFANKQFWSIVNHLHVEIKVSHVLMDLLVICKITVLITEKLKHSLPSVGTETRYKIKIGTSACSSWTPLL